MPLPIVPGSLVETPIGGTRLDSSAFREAALAPGKLAQAIGQDVGGLFQDVGQKIQDNRNAQTIFKADLAMRQAKDQFTADLVKMPDQNTWLPAWKDRSDQIRDQAFKGNNINHYTAKVLNNKFDVWQAATTSEINYQALRKEVNDTKESAIADSTYAAHQGDLPGAMAILQHAKDNHAMSDADVDRHSKRFPSIAAQSMADTAITSDPIHAPDLIKKFEKAIEPRVFIGVQARANESRNRQQAQNLNDLAVRLDNSPDGTIDPKTIEDQVKAGGITQRGASQLLLRMDKSKQKQNQADFTVGMMESHDHDFVDDKAPEASAAKLKEDYAHLPPPLRLRLYNNIDQRLKAAKTQGERQERPVETQVMNLMREDREKNGVTIPMAAAETPETTKKTGLFGLGAPQKIPGSVEYHHLEGGLEALRKMSDDDIKEKFGVGPDGDLTKDDLLKAEQLHYATISMKMRNWFADPANKSANFDQANDYRMGLERPYIMESVKNRLLKSANLPKFKTPDEAKKAKLPTNAPFLDDTGNIRTAN